MKLQLIIRKEDKEERPQKMAVKIAIPMAEAVPEAYRGKLGLYCIHPENFANETLLVLTNAEAPTYLGLDGDFAYNIETGIWAWSTPRKCEKRCRAIEKQLAEGGCDGNAEKDASES